MMNRMVKKDFAQEIAAVIRTAKNGDRLPELLKHYHWRDVAKAITLLADAERERLFRQMDAQQKRVLPGPGHLRRLGGAVGPEIGLVSVVAQDLAKGRAPAAGAQYNCFHLYSSPSN